MKNNNSRTIINISLLMVTIFLLWYILPAVRYYFNGTGANIVMAVVLGVWCILIIFLLKSKHILLYKHIAFIIINILFYIINLVLRRNDGNITEFIKMGIMYWFPAFIFIIYYLLDDIKSIKYLFKLCVICIIVTLIPTLIELIKDPTSLRWMAYYSSLNLEEQLMKEKYNIGDYGFIYSLLFCIPIFYLYISRNKNKKTFVLLLLLTVSAILLSSFSIAIFLGILSLGICIYSISGVGKKKMKLVILTGTILIMIVIVSFPSIIISFSNEINNDFVRQRVVEVANFLSNSNQVDGDLESRMQLYLKSFNTFKNNVLFGIGGYYYVDGIDIGYHSQMLDDMARYGAFYFINTIFLVISYKMFLSNKLCVNKKMKNVVLCEIIVYLVLLVVNPVYECSWISTMILLLLPCSLMLERDEKYAENL